MVVRQKACEENGRHAGRKGATNENLEKRNLKLNVWKKKSRISKE